MESPYWLTENKDDLLKEIVLYPEMEITLSSVDSNEQNINPFEECSVEGNKSEFCYNFKNAPEIPFLGEEIWTTDVIQRVSTLGVIMVIAIIGNTLIILLLTCSRYRTRKSRVNLFIMNLAIGDLLICFITMTTEILFVVFGEWKLGPVACKLLTYLEIVTLASTTFILTSMSVDRYLSLCRPLIMNSTIFAVVRAKRFISGSWVLAFIFAIPQLFIFVETLDRDGANGRVKYSCSSNGYTAEWQRKVYFTFLTAYILVIPAFIISFCYIKVVYCIWKKGRELAINYIINSESETSKMRNVVSKAKIKTLKMTFVIIITFIACWTPYFVSTLILVYSENAHQIPAPVLVFAETVALLQSALNPIIYGCFNFPLKREVVKMLSSRHYNNKRHEAIHVGACGTVLLTGKLVNNDIRKKTTVHCRRSQSDYFDGPNDKDNNRTVEFKLKVRFMTRNEDSGDSHKRDLVTI